VTTPRAAALLAIAIATAPPASALELRIAAGAGLADIEHLHEAGPVIEAAIERPVGHGAWRASAAWIGAQEVRTSGTRSQRGTIGDYWIAGAQGIYQHPIGRATIEAGAGIAWRTEARNVDYLLPNRANFDLTLGLRIGRTTLELRHLSNAWTRDSNRGQNWLQVGLAF
jgi:hypothetical protein